MLTRMPRAPRDTAAGIFHITTHSVRDTELFRDDIDRTRFLLELARATGLFGWACIAFCLMRTHYHLMLEVADGVMPRGMKSLNFRYAMAFNARHRTRGHVTERRYFSDRIRGEAHLLAAYRYIVRNPVAAGICDRPQDWPWSSYAGTIGHAPPHSFVDASRVLGLFEGPPEFAIARLRAYVEDA
jgi:putative transposase